MSLPPPPIFDPAKWGKSTPLIIGVAGGSGSGKTTIAEALVEAIKQPADKPGLWLARRLELDI